MFGIACGLIEMNANIVVTGCEKMSSRQISLALSLILIYLEHPHFYNVQSPKNCRDLKRCVGFKCSSTSWFCQVMQQ
jgi:hypothetical protein